MPIVGIDFVAKVNSALAEVNRLTGATRGALAAAQKEAIKLVAEEERATMSAARAAMQNAAAQRAAAGAFQSSARSSGQAAQGAASLTQQFIDMGVMLQGGASPLTILVTQGPQAATAISDMGGAANAFAWAMSKVGVVAGVLGPVTAAVVALGVAWKVAATEAENAEARQVAAANAATEAQKRHVDIDEIRRRTADDLALADGRVTKEILAQRDAVGRLNQAFGPEIEAQKERIRVAEQARAAAEKEYAAAAARAAVRSARTGGDAGPSVAESERFTAAIEASNREIADARAKLGGLGTELATLTPQVMRAATAEEHHAKGIRHSNEEMKAYLRTLELKHDIDRAVVERQSTFTAAQQEQADATRAARLEGADELTLIRMRTEARLDEAQATYDAAIAANGSQADRAAAARALESRIAAERDAQTRAEDEYFDELKKKRDRDVEAAERAARDKARAEREAQQQILSAVSNASSNVASITAAAYQSQLDNLTATQRYATESEAFLTRDQRAQLQKRVAAQREAALRAFEINKAAQIATAIVNTASAVVAALDDAPFPYNLALAGVAGAAGAVQVGTIASQRPAFHSGGVVTADLLTREAVLNRTATSRQGEGRIREMNAAADPNPGASVIVVNQIIGHRVMDIGVTKALQRGGRARDEVRRFASGTPGFRRLA